jgi:hypothetical protein
MTPAEVLRVELAERRARGEDFESAYGLSLRIALRVTSGRTLEEWRFALTDSEGAWRAAYERLDSLAFPPLRELLKAAA